MKCPKKVLLLWWLVFYFVINEKELAHTCIARRRGQQREKEVEEIKRVEN